MSVTKQQVAWCYRTLLGRTPKSEEAIRQCMRTANDFQALILSFVGSDEYLARNARNYSIPLSEGRMEVETAASPADLEALMTRLKNSSGVTNTLEDNAPETLSAEWISRAQEAGTAEADTLLAVLERHDFSNLDAKTCVEYGCGRGRVSLALAKVFKEVHGYDASSSELAWAERLAAAEMTRNVKFHSGIPGTFDTGHVCDFFYCRSAFETEPPPITRALIEAALKSLRAAGIALFQVPTYAPNYSFKIKEYLAAPPDSAQIHCTPQQDVFSIVADSHCRVLEVRENIRGTAPDRWISNTFVVQRLADHKWRWGRSRRGN